MTKNQLQWTKNQLQYLISEDDAIREEIFEKIRSQYTEPDVVGRELSVFWDPSLERLTYTYNPYDQENPWSIYLFSIEPGIGSGSTHMMEHCFFELQGEHLYFDRSKIFDFLYEVVQLGIKKQANLKTVLKECKAKNIDLSVFEGHDIEEVLDICLHVIECDLSFFIEDDWEHFYESCGDPYEVQKKGA